MTGDLKPECWVVSEGTAGMENQALGLAERLGLPIRVIRLKVAAPWRWIAPWSLGSPFGHLEPGADRLVPPWPCLVIGCGRQSIPFALGIKKASEGRTRIVQCQNPRVDPAYFDLVVPPEHDALAGPQVFPIIGSPNRITPGRLAAAKREFEGRFLDLRAPRIAVLIGGNSKDYRLGRAAAAAMGASLRALCAEHGLMVTASRRTAKDARAALRDALAGTGAYFWDGDAPNPYLGMLAWADAILVTADSVNMACEAGATGKPVHIVALPGGSPKFRRFHESLAARGVARPFVGAIGTWAYDPLDETGRAANKIKALLDL